MLRLISHDGWVRKVREGLHGNLLTLPRTSLITLGRPMVVPRAGGVLLLPTAIISTAILCTVQVQEGGVTGGEDTLGEALPLVASSPVAAGVGKPPAEAPHMKDAVDVGNPSDSLLFLPTFLRPFARSGKQAATPPGN